MKKEIAILFGLKVAEKRKEKGWLQGDLAKFSGVSKTYVGNLERGESNVTLEKVYLFAHTIGCSIQDLLPTDEEIFELASYTSHESAQSE
ncbi:MULTISPECIES: helix-turn-helix domain-containing protein [Vibrio]|uniref:helix-turn-helix domain-containing protein n=1 Tax=Vibrio TaxID=662 RepID=UPI001BD69A8A|nr:MULTISPECIES: helix-turn-helix transcriptional regulator [Vibrio]MBT0118281.1 helix-turn-helix transcriptional regulator [Vibrio alginolyticus]MCG9235857.1 helix-turn-helix domain-containing protein [Vibrio harveyi]MCG9586084.1 helix-turn-helix domain-containing protein [Vibrio harveyi]NRB69757.1 helix-turn-helix transcriptional regulator [Vibrio sp.]